MRPAAVAAADVRARVWLWGTIGLTISSLVAVVALAPPASATPVRALSWLLFTTSSVHVAATGGVFLTPAGRSYARHHQTRCLWIPAGLILGSAAAAALIAPASFQWLLLPYFGWQFYHYQKQNLGVAALAAAANRVPSLSQTERRALLLAGFATAGRLVADPRLLGLQLSTDLGWLRAAATAAFVVAVGVGVVALSRRPATARTGGFLAGYLTALIFGLPAFLFASPYAAVGGLTVAHGLQYLLLIGLVTGSDRQPGGWSRPVRLALLGNIALIGGVLLSTASHLHNADQLGRLAFGAYLGIVMTHFVIDAGIWRLRDPLARRFITEGLPYLVPAAKCQRQRGTPVATPATTGDPRCCSARLVSAVTDPSSTDIGCAT
jgi:hypothetical protein